MTPTRSMIASETETAPCPRCDGPITGPHDFKNNQGEPAPCPWVQEGERIRSRENPLLDPALYVPAPRDSNGQQMVYLPCIICGTRYGRPHQDSCPGGWGSHFTAPAPKGWNR